MSPAVFTSDFSLLDQAARDHPAYPAFVESMRGRGYGYDALWDAWAWFSNGWEMCEKHVDVRDHDRVSIGSGARTIGPPEGSS